MEELPTASQARELSYESVLLSALIDMLTKRLRMVKLGDILTLTRLAMVACLSSKILIRLLSTSKINIIK